MPGCLLLCYSVPLTASLHSLNASVCQSWFVSVWLGVGGFLSCFKSVGMKAHTHTHRRFAWAPIFTHSWGGHIELINDTNYNASLYWGIGFEEAPNCLQCLVRAYGWVWVDVWSRRSRTPHASVSCHTDVHRQAGSLRCTQVIFRTGHVVRKCAVMPIYRGAQTHITEAFANREGVYLFIFFSMTYITSGCNIFLFFYFNCFHFKIYFHWMLFKLNCGFCIMSRRSRRKSISLRVAPCITTYVTNKPRFDWIWLDLIQIIPCGWICRWIRRCKASV